jgi:hypothetical protein
MVTQKPQRSLLKIPKATKKGRELSLTFYNVPSSSHLFLGCNCFVAAGIGAKLIRVNLDLLGPVGSKVKLPRERAEHDDLCRWHEFYAREA